MTAARLRQWWADLIASFWLRPAVMTVGATIAADLLVRAEGVFTLPSWIERWVYAGGTAGARDVLGAIAAATIGVAGTTFSITVAALSLASSQMGPRLLRNFTRDPGNQYALGTLLATFAYALVALRSVHEAEEGAFVPQLAVSVALLLAFGCVGVLIWFLHHVAASINVDRVVALVHDDLSTALRALPKSDTKDDAEDEPEEPPELSCGAAATLVAPAGGYLRVLDDEALADWAAAHDAVLRLRVRPGGFVFPGSLVGEVAPAQLRKQAQAVLAGAMTLGDTCSIEQDMGFAARQLVEIGLRALSPGINDPFTAIAVLDRLGAALCDMAGRALPTGRTVRDGHIRLYRARTDYEGLVDTMFHMLRQSGAGSPAVMIRLLEVLAEIGAVERDPDRRHALRRHIELAREAALGGTADTAARAAVIDRTALAFAATGSNAQGVSPL
ncbi:DUF2254 domain-containing protein [Dankookia sp. P2]|uniref:DUF2254 domain-containing protein n=1 Tax=Dankookia sp. P2 TaxID=3423955 RepID=UPI003D6752F7